MIVVEITINVSYFSIFDYNIRYFLYLDTEKSMKLPVIIVVYHQMFKLKH